MDWVGLIQSILGVAAPLLDKLWLSQVTQYLTQYEANEAALQTALALYPNWDASQIESMMATRKRLEDAISQQVKLVTATGSPSVIPPAAASS